MIAWKKNTNSLFISLFFSSWAQRWDQKSGRSLSTALQASNQRKDFMEVSEVGGELGWRAGDCITRAAGKKPLDYLAFASAADPAAFTTSDGRSWEGGNCCWCWA